MTHTLTMTNNKRRPLLKIFLQTKPQEVTQQQQIITMQTRASDPSDRITTDVVMKFICHKNV